MKTNEQFTPTSGVKHKKHCGHRHWLLSEIGVVPLPIDITHMKEFVLTTLVPPGKGFALNLATDEAVDAQSDGSFAVGSVISGDSLAPNIMPTSTNQSIDVVLRGDGGSGVKEVNVKVDGHVGEGDLPLNLKITYTVGHPDATDFTNIKEGGVVDLPAATPTAARVARNR